MMKQRHAGIKYYGYHACLKLWEKRPQDILRVYVEKKQVKDLGPLLKWCATHSKAYHILSAEEMEKVTASVHHEGLSILAKELLPLDFPTFLAQLPQEGALCLLYLDGVQNPHNIGSIMRVAAHFGIPYILGAHLPNLSPSTYRIAQGGAECVQLVSLDNVKKAFHKLTQAGFMPVASSSHGGKSLFQYRFRPRTVIVMGSESEGVHPSLLGCCKETLLIPGTGLVESLNVSVATGLFLSEYWRQIR